VQKPASECDGASRMLLTYAHMINEHTEEKDEGSWGSSCRERHARVCCLRQEGRAREVKKVDAREG
jgi:hypothetical protein